MNHENRDTIAPWIAFLPLVVVAGALAAVRGWFGDAGEQSLALLLVLPLLTLLPALHRRTLWLWLAWLLAGVAGALAGPAISRGATVLLGIGSDLVLLAGLLAGIALVEATERQRERWIALALVVAVIVASSVWWAPAAPLVDGYPDAVGHARLFAGSARAAESAALLLLLTVVVCLRAGTPGWFRPAASAAALLTLGAGIELSAGAATALSLLVLGAVVTGSAVAAGLLTIAAAGAVALWRGLFAWKIRAWTAGAALLSGLDYPLGAGHGEFSAALEPVVGRRLDVLVYEAGKIFRAPENGFVGALVERGWPGLVLALAVLGGGLVWAVRKGRRAETAGMAGLMLLSTVSDPTWTPAMAVCAGMLLAWCLLPGTTVPIEWSGRQRRLLRTAPVVLGLLAAAVSWQEAASLRMLATAAMEQMTGYPDREEATLVRYAGRQRRNEYAWPRLVDKRLTEERVADAWDAAGHWRRVRPRSPLAAATATVAGVAAQQFEDAARAVPVWHESRGAHPLWLYRNGVIALAYAQQTTDALALAEEALAQWPDNLELLRLRGRLLMTLGRWADAVDVWTAITENEQANLKDLQFLEYAMQQAGSATTGTVIAPGAVTDGHE